MYFLQADKRDTPHVVCETRTLERSLQQMAVIRSQPTQEKRNAMQTAFGLRTVDNPMLDIKVDMYRYVRVREQHLCETKLFM